MTIRCRREAAPPRCGRAARWPRWRRAGRGRRPAGCRLRALQRGRIDRAAAEQGALHGDQRGEQVLAAAAGLAVCHLVVGHLLQGEQGGWGCRWTRRRPGRRRCAGFARARQSRARRAPGGAGSGRDGLGGADAGDHPRRVHRWLGRIRHLLSLGPPCARAGRARWRSLPGACAVFAAEVLGVRAGTALARHPARSRHRFCARERIRDWRCFEPSLLVLLLALPAQAQVRIKDIADMEGIRGNQLVGYGLVVGLNGTGDKLDFAVFTRQSLIGMLAAPGREHPRPAGEAQDQERRRGARRRRSCRHSGARAAGSTFPSPRSATPPTSPAAAPSCLQCCCWQPTARCTPWRRARWPPGRSPPGALAVGHPRRADRRADPERRDGGARGAVPARQPQRAAALACATRT